jgi:hypothetical protein
MTRESSPLLPDATIRTAITIDTPDGTAERLWSDLSDRLDATQQRRRFFVLAPPAMRVAFAAIAVIAVMGTAVYFLGPTQGVGVPQPTAQPTVTPTATPEPSVPLTSYTSSRFAYSAEYPAAWMVIPATEDWTSVYAPDHGGPRMDYIGAKPFGSRIYLSSVRMTPERDDAAWLSTLDGHTAESCDPTSNRHTITIDGVTMRQEDQYCGETVYIIEVLGAHNGRFYVIDLVNESPLTTAERATFDRFLASFRFAP